jgi:hypothetical protein
VNPERWQRLQDLVEEALARPKEVRRAFVESACGDDAELARRPLFLPHASAARRRIRRPRRGSACWRAASLPGSARATRWPTAIASGGNLVEVGWERCTRPGTKSSRSRSPSRRFTCRAALKRRTSASNSRGFSRSSGANVCRTPGAAREHGARHGSRHGAAARKTRRALAGDREAPTRLCATLCGADGRGARGCASGRRRAPRFQDGKRNARDQG